METHPNILVKDFDDEFIVVLPDGNNYICLSKTAAIIFFHLLKGASENDILRKMLLMFPGKSDEILNGINTVRNHPLLRDINTFSYPNKSVNTLLSSINISKPLEVASIQSSQLVSAQANTGNGGDGFLREFS